MLRNTNCLLLSALCILLNPTLANANVVRIDFTGTITGVGGDGPNVYSLARGNTFSAFVTYDDSVLDERYSNSPSGRFPYSILSYGFQSMSTNVEANEYSQITLFPQSDSYGAYVDFYANSQYVNATSLFSDVFGFHLPAVSSSIDVSTSSLKSVQYSASLQPWDGSSNFYFNHNNLTLGGMAGTVQYGGKIEAFSVSAVPEPETYAMMLAGLALVGAAARRRRVI